MSPWTLKAYRRRGSKISIAKEWYDEVGYDVWAVFAWHMDYLCGQEADKWGRPWAEKLRGECAGLLEIIFEVDNVQYRPLGFFSGRMEFTFLIFATEVGDKFVPPTACAIAQKRKKELEDGDGGSSVFIIAENTDEEASDE
jgi:hypothetical protein